jgi:hypothetical protein
MVLASRLAFSGFVLTATTRLNMAFLLPRIDVFRQSLYSAAGGVNDRRIVQGGVTLFPP